MVPTYTHAFIHSWPQALGVRISTFNAESRPHSAFHMTVIAVIAEAGWLRNVPSRYDSLLSPPSCPGRNEIRLAVLL